MCAHVHEQASGPAKCGQWDQPAHSSHRNQFRRLLAKTNFGLWVYIGVYFQLKHGQRFRKYRLVAPLSSIHVPLLGHYRVNPELLFSIRFCLRHV